MIKKGSERKQTPPPRHCGQRDQIFSAVDGPVAHAHRVKLFDNKERTKGDADPRASDVIGATCRILFRGGNFQRDMCCFPRLERLLFDCNLNVISKIEFIWR